MKIHNGFFSSSTSAIFITHINKEGYMVARVFEVSDYGIGVLPQSDLLGIL